MDAAPRRAACPRLQVVRPAAQQETFVHEEHFFGDVVQPPSKVYQLLLCRAITQRHVAGGTRRDQVVGVEAGGGRQHLHARRHPQASHRRVNLLQAGTNNLAFHSPNKTFETSVEPYHNSRANKNRRMQKTYGGP